MTEDLSSTVSESDRLGRNSTPFTRSLSVTPSCSTLFEILNHYLM